MSTIYLILILGITIFVHELGHFIFAKRAGIYVYEFALGMGPVIFKFNRKNDETLYSLRLFPIGGYVKMAGESIEDDDSVPVRKRMQNKTWLQRFLTISAGIVFNFIFAIIVLFFIGLFYGSPKMTPYVGDILKGSSADIAGMVKGDIIVKLNDHNIYSTDQFMVEEASLKSGEITLVLKTKTNETKEVTIKKVDGLYGFGLKEVFEDGFVAAIKYAFAKTGSLVLQMVLVLKYLFMGRIGLESLAGPVGVYTIVDQAAGYGIVSVIYLNAIISINVGFMNLLPIPAFDGGRLAFLIIEKIKGKPVSPKIENTIHLVGFGLLMILMLLITYKDIINLFS